LLLTLVDMTKTGEVTFLCR